MHPIHERHLSEPGLVVLDITAPDETTPNTVMTALQEQWATSGVPTGQRTPGQPGIRARVHADTNDLAPASTQGAATAVSDRCAPAEQGRNVRRYGSV
ncbi:DUF6207 family protein [Streptomyces sp. NBC_00654]|uniref:DUF6207 family protein n=1 Tax=Streptomyces sp. NBC_00654 TaxID=2975799 RepID=UPI00225720AD|nr:DUF6207 family protein [Streptomyces sp. NBC_00654]MCX4967045.1 DUF6207 family protein [Streptomyces sp. NBC_00654]